MSTFQILITAAALWAVGLVGVVALCVAAKRGDDALRASLIYPTPVVGSWWEHYNPSAGRMMTYQVVRAASDCVQLWSDGSRDYVGGFCWTGPVDRFYAEFTPVEVQS